jgi:hypothetical protein
MRESKTDKEIGNLQPKVPFLAKKVPTPIHDATQAPFSIIKACRPPMRPRERGRLISEKYVIMAADVWPLAKPAMNRDTRYCNSVREN